MLNTQLMRNLNRNGLNMQNLQNQMATGRKINKPSDDPVGVTFALRYRSELSSNDQYQKNIDSAISYLSFTDEALGQAGNVVQRIRELTVKGATSSNTQTSLDSIRVEVEKLRDQLLDIGNSSLNGKYIFNGQTYDIKPYDTSKMILTDADLSDPNKTVDPSDVTTDTKQVEITLGPGINIGVNVTGNDIFGDPSDPSNANDQMFTVLDNIIESLKTGNTDAVGDQLANLDTRMDKLLSLRAEVGARFNRVELMESRMEDLEINLTELQSKTEDVDMAELILKAKVAENIYNASLSAGSKIIQPSLVDFIR